MSGNGATEQFNGREGETATLLSRCPLNSELRGGGFAPRHLNRSVLILCFTKRHKHLCHKIVRCGVYSTVKYKNDKDKTNE
jgi:hypothetical protein